MVSFEGIDIIPSKPPNNPVGAVTPGNPCSAAEPDSELGVNAPNAEALPVNPSAPVDGAAS